VRKFPYQNVPITFPYLLLTNAFSNISQIRKFASLHSTWLECLPKCQNFGLLYRSRKNDWFSFVTLLNCYKGIHSEFYRVSGDKSLHGVTGRLGKNFQVTMPRAGAHTSRASKGSKQNTVSRAPGTERLFSKNPWYLLGKFSKKWTTKRAIEWYISRHTEHWNK
jgi:hypothetical protein